MWCSLLRSRPRSTARGGAVECAPVVSSLGHNHCESHDESYESYVLRAACRVVVDAQTAVGGAVRFRLFELEYNHYYETKIRS